jgi:hypothetical protein
MLLNIPRLALSIFLVLAAFSPAFSEAKYSVARIEATGWDSLVAEIDGISYSITTEDWEFLPLMSIEHQLDLDGDGFLEAILSTHHGGNAIGPHFFVVSHRGDAFFSIDTHYEMEGWPTLELLERDGETLILIKNLETGAGNTSIKETQALFRFKYGKLELLSLLENSALIWAEKEITGEQLSKADAPSLSLFSDIDLDGQEDEFRCKYWERWGAAQCEIFFANKKTLDLNLGCNRFGILETTSMGMKQLVCNRALILSFNGSNYSD